MANRGPLLTRLGLLLGAAILASACCSHTHETVVVQPGQTERAHVHRHHIADHFEKGHRDRHEHRKHRKHRKAAKSRPATPAQPAGSTQDEARPGEARPGAKAHPRPSLDRKQKPRKIALCTDEGKKHRKTCRPKRSKG
jgi:hypothetical protein